MLLLSIVCVPVYCGVRWLGGVTVSTLDLRSKGREFFRLGHYQVVTTWMGQVNHLGTVYNQAPRST